MPRSKPSPAPARFAPSQKAFYRLAVVLMIVGVLFWAKVVLLPLALAVLFSFVLTPAAEWLENRRLGRVPSALLVTAAAVGLIVAVGWVTVHQAEKLAADAPKYQDNVLNKVRPVVELVKRLERLEDSAVPGSDPKPAGENTKPNDPPSPVVVKSQGAGALSYLPSLAQPAAEVAANFLLVVVLTIFLIVQRESARDRLIGLAGRRQLTTTTRALEDAGRRVSRYLLLQLATNATMGVGIALGLYLIGVPYAALWGVLGAALRFLPYVGIWLSSLFPFALALAVFPGWGPAFLVLALYGGLDLTMSNAVEPLLFGHGTGVSSLALLLAAVFWAWLWGPVGLLLAVPMTVCLVVLGEHVRSLRYLRTLLGDAPQVDPAMKFYHRVLSHDFDEAALIVGEEAKTKPLIDIYDGVLLPALAQAKTEREVGDLEADEEGRVYRAVRDTLTGVLAAARTGGAGRTGGPGPAVVGCSTRGEADRIGLGMLRDVAAPAGCEVAVVPAGKLLAEVETRVKDGKEVLAVVAAVSPGGLAQAAGLCRQVKARFPKVRVVVGRWGMTGDTTKANAYLTDAGADKSAWSLKETLDEAGPEGGRAGSARGGTVGDVAKADGPAKPQAAASAR